MHQIKRWQDEGRAFHLVDVREESEWARAICRGRVPWPRGDRAGQRRAIRTPDTELYLYCGGDFAPILVAENLQKMGIPGSSASMEAFVAGARPDTLSNP